MGLLSIIKSNPSSRKIFGKKEIEIIEKQMNGRQLSQSEKNRLSRDIRAKLDFIKDAARFEGDFELKKSMNISKFVAKVKDNILKDELGEKVRAILLFGSHVNGNPTSRSDVDICVVFRNSITLRDATKFRIRISGEFDNKLDVQIFNFLPQKIKRRIAKKNRVIFKARDFDNLLFSIKYLKDEDYFIRMKNFFGEIA